MGCQAEIAGYPAEKPKRHKAYRGSGKIFKVIKTKLGGYVLTYDIYTSLGMSGSPIFIKDKAFAKLALESQIKLGKTFFESDTL